MDAKPGHLHRHVYVALALLCGVHVLCLSVIWMNCHIPGFNGDPEFVRSVLLVQCGLTVLVTPALSVIHALYVLIRGIVKAQTRYDALAIAITLLLNAFTTWTAYPLGVALAMGTGAPTFVYACDRMSS